LLIVKIPYKTFCICEHCGWYAPEGFEKVRLAFFDSRQFIPEEAYYYEESAEGPNLRTFGRVYLDSYAMDEHIGDFLRTFLKIEPNNPNPQPWSQPPQQPQALAPRTGRSDPEAPTPPARRVGGNKPNPEREKSRQLVRAVLQRHRERVLNGEIKIREVADELKAQKQKCWHEDGWHGHAATNLISQEMKALRRLH
jgi:hypothetical protein